MSINLFHPYRIGKLEIKNRFIRSATWDGTADVAGGVTENSLALYRNLAEGNIGLIITGFAFVSQQGQSARGQYGAYSDDLIPGLSKLAKVVHDNAGKICLQIVHGGINSNFLASKGVCLPAVSKRTGETRVHREMTEEDIQHILDDFASSARRAIEAGFDAIQLHGAHGYLLSQFLSPLYNKRTDKWGGSAENRRRFHVELIRQIRRKIGQDFPLLIKFGVKDDQEGGLSLEEGVETAKQMVGAGIDAIEVSSAFGSSSHEPNGGKSEITPFRERASAVKRSVNVPIAAVGGIRSLDTAQNIVDSGDADLISMSRPFIREPDLINRWQHNSRTALCISCNKCFGVIGSGQGFQCGEELRVSQS